MTVGELKKQLAEMPDDWPVYLRVFRHTTELKGVYGSTPHVLNVPGFQPPYEDRLVVLDSDKGFQR